MFQDALLSTAEEVIQTRNGKPMESAKAYLADLREEDFLQLVTRLYEK